MNILLLVKAHHDYYQLLIDAAHALGHTLTIAHYSEIFIDFSKRTTTMSIKHTDIASFDVVYLRTVGLYSEHAVLITHYCNQHDIPLIDPVFSSNKQWIDRKSYEYFCLNEIGLPIIPSWYVSKSTLSQLPTQSYPIIAKLTRGSQGENVYLCHSLQELDALLTKNEHLLIQPFVKNQGDIRVFIVGNEVVAAMKRVATTDEYRNNVSLGAQTKPYTLSSSETDLALQASKALEFAIAGVDLLQDENGVMHIIEVNRAPQFLGIMNATGINIPEKMIHFIASQAL